MSRSACVFTCKCKGPTGRLEKLPLGVSRTRNLHLTQVNFHRSMIFVQLEIRAKFLRLNNHESSCSCHLIEQTDNNFLKRLNSNPP
jgi:hypothetical protein